MPDALSAWSKKYSSTNNVLFLEIAEARYDYCKVWLTQDEFVVVVVLLVVLLVLFWFCPGATAPQYCTKTLIYLILVFLKVPNKSKYSFEVGHAKEESPYY